MSCCGTRSHLTHDVKETRRQRVFHVFSQTHTQSGDILVRLTAHLRPREDSEDQSPLPFMYEQIQTLIRRRIFSLPRGERTEQRGIIVPECVSGRRVNQGHYLRFNI